MTMPSKGPEGRAGDSGAAPFDPLGFIEGVNNIADSMDAMKVALETRGWSSPMAEQMGAAFGQVIMSQIGR